MLDYIGLENMGLINLVALGKEMSFIFINIIDISKSH